MQKRGGAHYAAWRPLPLRQDKDLSCLLNPLMSGIQKGSTYKNYFFCLKTELDHEVYFVGIFELANRKSRVNVTIWKFKNTVQQRIE